MKYVVAAVLFGTLCWTLGFAEDAIYPERPVSVRVTGTLLPADGQAHEDIITVPIFVQGQPWLLRVGKVEELTAHERQQAVKHDILLRQVRFYGPEELIDKLRRPDMAGKVLTIEGRLDAREQRFLVTAVQEAPGQHP